MLLGIDPLLRGPLIAALDAMGHGDALVVCDANFPAQRVARHGVHALGVDGPAAVRVLCTLFPVDPDEPPALMAHPGSATLPVQEEMLSALGGRAAGAPTPPDPTALPPTMLGRFEFYAAAAEAEVVVLTTELRGYGNLLVRKAALTGEALPTNDA